MIVWGIKYIIKDLDGEWDKHWIGPCGIFMMSFCKRLGKNKNSSSLAGRPIFFRTKKLAQQEINKLMQIGDRKNWIKYKVVKIKLTWKVVK